MPAICETLGLKFDFPENWQFDEPAEGESIAVLASPETAFLQISRHPAGTELEALFDEAIAALRAEYKEIEAHPGSPESYEGATLTGFDVNFYCLDFTNTCRIRGFEGPEATYLLLCQAEDREMARTTPVFQAMLTSLFRHRAEG